MSPKSRPMVRHHPWRSRHTQDDNSCVRVYLRSYGPRWDHPKPMELGAMMESKPRGETPNRESGPPNQYAKSDSPKDGHPYDPYLQCFDDVLAQVNVTWLDCVTMCKTFKERDYLCFSGMPHEREIKRKHEKESLRYWPDNLLS